jgi:hypothetical protein
MFKGELRAKAQLSVATCREGLFSDSLASIIRVYLYIVVG